MLLDQSYDNERIRQFAGNTEHISRQNIDEFRELMTQTESPEFYRGLIAGYANSLAVVQKILPEQQEAYIAMVLAVVAAHFMKKFPLTFLVDGSILEEKSEKVSR